MGTCIIETRPIPPILDLKDAGRLEDIMTKGNFPLVKKWLRIF